MVQPSDFDDYDWTELPDNIKAALVTLGYTQAAWDSDADPLEDEDFVDLTPEQQAAAVVIGYTKETWDAE